MGIKKMAAFPVLKKIKEGERRPAALVNGKTPGMDFRGQQGFLGIKTAEIPGWASGRSVQGGVRQVPAGKTEALKNARQIGHIRVGQNMDIHRAIPAKIGINSAETPKVRGKTAGNKGIKNRGIVHGLSF
jgi:hypothetical protein